MAKKLKKRVKKKSINGRSPSNKNKKSKVRKILAYLKSRDRGGKISKSKKVKGKKKRR